MRLRLVQCLTAVALAWPMMAQASDITVTGRVAGWTAFAGLANNGTQVCGIFEAGNDGRSFHIKSFDNQSALVVQIFKPGWSIPSGTKIPATLQFAGFSAWSAMAVGAGNMVEFKVPSDKIQEFASQFRAADQFRLTFLAGNEGAWTGQLTGSGAALNMLGTCVAGRGSQPSNPSSPSVRSQPFSPVPSAPTPAPAGSPRFSQPKQLMV